MWIIKKVKIINYYSLSMTVQIDVCVATINIKKFKYKNIHAQNLLIFGLISNIFSISRYNMILELFFIQVYPFLEGDTFWCISLHVLLQEQVVWQRICKIF